MNRPSRYQDAIDKGLLHFDVENLRQWLHRIEEAAIQEKTPFGKAISDAASTALMRNTSAPTGFGLPDYGIPIKADGALPPISLGRAEAAEILGLIDPITKALEALPYAKARPAIDLVDAIRETICEALPGGYADLCEGCGMPIGNSEVAARDDENALNFCANCYRDEATADEIEAGDVDAIDLARDLATGWIEWAGGTCPLHPDAMVDYKDRGRVNAYFTARAGDIDANRWLNTGSSGEIVAYRPRLDGWVEWNGGECPLHPDARVEVRMRSGAKMSGLVSGGSMWRHNGGDYDIVAYRLVKPARAETPGEDSAVAHGEPIFDTRPTEPPAVPRFDPSARINWDNAADAAQAVRDGKLPEGYRVEAGVLIVPFQINPPGLKPRGHATIEAMFDEIRSDRGEVIKTKDKNWAPPEAEELQLLRQLMRHDLLLTHPASIVIADRLDAAGYAKLIDAVQDSDGKLRFATAGITAKGKRRLIDAGLIEEDIDLARLADAIAAMTPYETASGTRIVWLQMSPDRRDYIVARLREAAGGSNG